MINQENLIKIINFRKKMHEHPEVSNHEDNTRAFENDLTDMLGYSIYNLISRK